MPHKHKIKEFGILSKNFIIKQYLCGVFNIYIVCASWGKL